MNKLTHRLLVVPLVALLVTGRGLAQTVSDGTPDNTGALGDVIIKSLRALLESLFGPIKEFIENYGSAVLDTIVGTPHPDAIFTSPTNDAWPNIYGYYWDFIVPLSLFLFGLAVALVIFLESTSYLFSNYHRAKLKKRAFTGLLGILAWWWIAAISLQFANALTGALVPSLSNISLFQVTSFGAIGTLGIVLSLATDLVLFILIALIYLIRQLVLYMFVLLMPILIVLWIPGVGPFSMVSRFARQLAGFYVPFLFMTVPVAVLFRLGELLGSSADLSMGGVGAWLTALVIPILAILAPIALVWQAGAIFFVADRASHHVSSQRARHRIETAQSASATTAQGGRNFTRGAMGKPAVERATGSTLADGSSRAHTAGSWLNSVGTRTRTADRAGDRSEAKSGGRSSTERDSSRNTDFENLRGDRGRSSTDDDTDDTPRYIY